MTGSTITSAGDLQDRPFPYFTIGHSTRAIDEFVDLLRVAGISCVIDIRTVRRSRRNPQYNEDVLPGALKPHGLRYISIPELGGLRKRVQSVERSVNAFWTNESFHNYADYALTDSFARGLEALIRIGRRERCCMMCSEAVWWRCHRRIVSDYLIGRGESVFHLMGMNRADPAAITSGALLGETGSIIYPAQERIHEKT